MSPMSEWYDKIEGAPPHLSRMLAGLAFRVRGDDDEETLHVVGVRGVTVGIDSTNLWACIDVEADNGGHFSFYTDGGIHDDDDRRVGSHDLRLGHDGETFKVQG